MQKYDLTVLVKSAEVGEKVEKIVAAVGGKAGRMVELGKKQLAYPIKKAREAQFLNWALELPKEAVLQLTKKLTVDRDIIRHLLVKSEARNSKS